MNNKFYSQAVTMTFLAVWHGFHSGYYLTFFNEILVMQFEKQFIPLCQRNPTLSKLWEDSLIAKALFIVIGKVSGNGSARPGVVTAPAGCVATRRWGTWCMGWNEKTIMGTW